MLEDIIRSYASLPSSSTGSGWYPCKCPVCNDYKVRGAFKFEDEAVVYHCFNCPSGSGFDPAESTSISDKFRIVLDAFNIPASEYEKVQLHALQLHHKGKVKNRDGTTVVIDTGPKSIKMFPQFHPLKDAAHNDAWAELAKYYLEDRSLDWEEYPYYMCEPGDTMIQKIWRKRIIIPAYKDKELIFYQGRDLTDKLNPKYLSSAGTEMGKILYGFDELKRHTQDPLYIVEGFFDAHLIDGVAVVHNMMTEHQLKYLNACQRPKVVIPDMFGDGWRLAEQAVQNGWSLSIPDVGQQIKDVNEAVGKYGLLYVLQTIQTNTVSGTAANVAIAKIRTSDKLAKRKKKALVDMA